MPITRKVTSIVHALVGNEYVPGYQVHVHRYTLEANGVTVATSSTERQPTDRALTLSEACALSDEINGSPP